MRSVRRKTKETIKDNLSSTKCSESQSDDIESSLLELNDNSIALYSTIQSVWYDYQMHISSFPCLDILAALASEEQSGPAN